MSAMDLPPELWLDILVHLSPADFLALKRTNQQLRALLREQARTLTNTLILTHYAHSSSLLLTRPGPHGWLIPTHPAILSEEARLKPTPAKRSPQPRPAPTRFATSCPFAPFSCLPPNSVDTSSLFTVERYDKKSREIKATKHLKFEFPHPRDFVTASNAKNPIMALAKYALRSLSPAAAQSKTSLDPSTNSNHMTRGSETEVEEKPPQPLLLTDAGPQYLQFLREKDQDIRIASGMFVGNAEPEQKFADWVALYCVRRTLQKLQWVGVLREVDAMRVKAVKAVKENMVCEIRRKRLLYFEGKLGLRKKTTNENGNGDARKRALEQKMQELRKFKGYSVMEPTENEVRGLREDMRWFFA